MNRQQLMQILFICATTALVSPLAAMEETFDQLPKNNYSAEKPVEAEDGTQWGKEESFSTNVLKIEFPSTSIRAPLAAHSTFFDFDIPVATQHLPDRLSSLRAVASNEELIRMTSLLLMDSSSLPGRERVAEEKPWTLLSMKERCERNPQRLIQTYMFGDMLDLEGGEFMGKLGDDAMVSLTPHILSQASRINKLYLNNNDLSPKGMEALKDILINLPNLTHLNLSKNPLGDEGIKILGSFLPDMKSLRDLGLSYTQVGDEGITALIPCLPRSCTVNLAGNSYGIAVREKLVKAGFLIPGLNFDCYHRSQR